MFDSSLQKLAALTAVLITTSALTACAREPEATQPPASEPASAPAPTADQSGVQSFEIGEAEATALRDGGLGIPNDGKTIAINHPPEDVAALLTAAGQPTEKLQLSIQPLLVNADGKVLLFDTGAGANMGPTAGDLPKSLAAAGFDPGSVTDIFISHVHGDHVGGLANSAGQAAFPNATIHISSPEWEYLKGMSAETAGNIGIAQHAALVAAMEPKVATFSPDSAIIPGVVKAVEIKGHTPGHSGYLITSGDESLLYIGDTMHHFIVSVQQPDWTINFDGDAPTAEASRKELLAKSADSGQRIYAVHFPFPGVGKVERKADGFIWVAEPL